MTVGFGTFFPKISNTKFVVRNIAPQGKRIRIFQYPINNGETRDLLAIPAVSEADIRHSLLKGELAVKIKYGELEIVDSDIDLLQFNAEQKSFLENAGVNKGLAVTSAQGGALTDEQHQTLRQLIHLADGVGGPMEGFTSGAYRETLPAGDAFPTDIIWWESSAKLKKLVEKNITRNEDQEPTIIAWKVYDTDGSTILSTITDTITYSGAFETTRTRIIS